jgi:hypothetical protein
MIHKFISSSVIVGEVYENFNIKTHDWEDRSPMWIYHALGRLGINRFTIERVPLIIPFKDHRFPLPEEATLIKRIHFFDFNFDLGSVHPYYNSNLLGQTGFINDPNYDPHAGGMPSSPSYIQGEIKTHFTVRGSWVHVTNFEEGKAVVIYKSLPAEFDKKLNQTFPIIPDDENLKHYLRKYILMQLLYRGTVHPIFNLTVNNPWVNPQMEIEQKLEKKAKISVNRMDMADLHKVHKVINTFIAPRGSMSFYLQDVKS